MLQKKYFHVIQCTEWHRRILVGLTIGFLKHQQTYNITDKGMLLDKTTRWYNQWTQIVRYLGKWCFAAWWHEFVQCLTSFMSTVDALVVLTVEGAKCLVLGGNTSIFDVIAQLDNFCHFIEWQGNIVRQCAIFNRIFATATDTFMDQHDIKMIMLQLLMVVWRGWFLRWEGSKLVGWASHTFLEWYVAPSYNER